MTRFQLTALLLIPLIIACEQRSSEQAKEPHIERSDLPDFSKELEAKQAFRKFFFMEDGYPGKQISADSIFIHPMYGAYVLLDYAKQYATHPSNELKDGIKIVADACLARMEVFKSSLVFRYPKGEYVSKANKAHISGLTQSYYLKAFQKAGEITGDEKYIDAAKNVFASLLIPKSEGGVLNIWEGGVSIEEIPEIPNSYILNGWASALINLKDYALLSGNPSADSLFDLSVQSMCGIIELYDFKAYANSSYALTGFQFFRIRNGTPSRLQIGDSYLNIPSEPKIKIKVSASDTASRWSCYYFARDFASANTVESNRILRLNLVLSKIDYPKENSIILSLDAEHSGPLYFEAFTGIYDPLTSSMSNNEWIVIDTADLIQGKQEIEIAMPWKHSELIAYPTNFSKHIRGKNYNLYHFVHIHRLQQLLRYASCPAFEFYIDQWIDYTYQWPKMPLYDAVEKVRSYHNSDSLDRSWRSKLDPAVESY